MFELSHCYDYNIITRITGLLDSELTSIVVLYCSVWLRFLVADILKPCLLHSTHKG